MGGYDGHLIFQNLAKIEVIKEPEVNAKTTEKFVTFSIGHLKFKYSLQFLNSSLAKLVNNLSGKVKNGKKPEDVFTNTWEYFKIKTLDDKFKMLSCKGVYPYVCMHSHERFDEDKLSGLSLSAVLMYTNIELEIPTDLDMHI